MADILRYTRGDELEPVAITWYEPDGTLYDFSTGWTWRARIGTGSGFLVEKTTGFTGAATAPNLSINFTAGELDGVGSGTYHLDVQATLTATGQTITRTWLFQILAGVGTDTLPQNLTGLGVLGDLSVDGDFTMPAATISGGVATTGVIRGHTIQFPWAYTLSAVPADVSVGTALHVPVNVTVNNTGGGLGPQFQTGHFGPRGIVNVEGIARYAQNMTAFGFAPVGIGDFLTLANNAGAARTLVPSWSHLSARTVLADGAVCTLAANDTAQGGAGFADHPVYCSVNTGQLEGLTNNHEIIHFNAGGAIIGNVDIRKRIGFDVAGIGTTSFGTGHWDVPGSTWDTNSITLDEEIGVRVRQFTAGVLKLGLSTAHPIRLMDTDLTLSGTNPLIHVSNARTLTLTSSPAISAVDFSPTLIFEDDTTAFGVGQMFNASPIYKNVTGETRSLGSIIGSYGVNMNPRFRADNAAVSMASAIGFRANILVDRLGSGAFTITSLIDFQSAPSVDTGNTATTRKGVEIADVAGAGTVTTNIALDVAAQAKGATNIGIRNASTYVATPLAQTLSAAGNAITATAEVKALTNSTGGSLTLTSAPTIADGQTGQEIELVNVGAQDIVIQDQGTLTSSNLRLTAATLTLQPRDSVRLRYNSTIGDWVQCGPLVNVL